jgi:hypothetical protein
MGAALFLAAAPALAQTTQIEPTATSNRPIILGPPSGSPAMDPRQSKAPTAFGEMRASQLIGKSIYNTGGESMGEIEDIVLNRSNNAAAALVGMGGYFGMGERQVAVLLSDLEMQGGNIVVKTLTRTDFQRKPAYQANDWARHDRDRLIGTTILR